MPSISCFFPYHGPLLTYTAPSEPPPGVKATWRELDEDESDGIDADSTSSEEEIDCSEHFHKLALSQYDRLIENDPTNSKLIQRRQDLIDAKQRDEDESKCEPKMDVDLP